MRVKQICIATLALFLLALAGCATPAQEPQPTIAPNTLGTLTVTFDFARQSGYATNQFAVWITDYDGRFVKTLCATAFTAKGGYKNRPDSLAFWVGQAMGSDFDAVAGATPKSGELSYVWDCTDQQGNAVPPGLYRFIVEGTLRWSNTVLYAGQIEIGRGNAGAQAARTYVFKGEVDRPGQNEDSPTLNEDSPECGMISNVKAEYIG